MAEMDKTNGSKMFLVFLKTLLKDFAQIEDAALENKQKCEIIENAYNSKDFTPLIPLWNEIALEDGHVDPPRMVTKMHFASISIFFFILPLIVFARIELNDFFSFGPTNGDTLLPHGDDNGQEVTISRPFPFFNSSQNFIYVNTNGAISLKDVITQYSPSCGPASTNYIMIAPFWSDVETSHSGTTAGVYYRESTDATVLLKAKEEVQRAFPGLYPTLNLNWAFITTWSNVTFYDAQICYNSSTDLAPRNTFQAIVTTDGVFSFVIFNYNKLTWSAGKASGSDCNGRGGLPAKAGLDSGDGQNFLLIGDSCSEDVINLVEQSNVNQPGKWIFGTGKAQIQTPKPVVPTTQAPEEEEKCENGWTYFAETQSCYMVIFNCSFDQCENICQSKGSHLTSIHSQSENKFVNDLAATGQPQWNFNQTIIGFHQIGGRWVWIDSSPFSYHQWAPGQPDFNRKIQWCGLTFSDVATFPGKWGLNQYFWDDVECNIPARSAVCKKAAAAGN